jgi:hypothetical protein
MHLCQWFLQVMSGLHQNTAHQSTTKYVTLLTCKKEALCIRRFSSSMRNSLVYYSTSNISRLCSAAIYRGCSCSAHSHAKTVPVVPFRDENRSVMTSFPTLPRGTCGHGTWILSIHSQFTHLHHIHATLGCNCLFLSIYCGLRCESLLQSFREANVLVLGSFPILLSSVSLRLSTRNKNRPSRILYGWRVRELTR